MDLLKASLSIGPSKILSVFLALNIVSILSNAEFPF